MFVCGSTNELDVDVNGIGDFLHASFQQIRDAHTAGLRAGMATALSELK